MRYLGNKRRLLDDITSFAERHNVQGQSFTDAFAGTGAVGAHFKRLGYQVTACDLLKASFVAQVAQLELSSSPSFSALLSKPAIKSILRSSKAKLARSRYLNEHEEADETSAAFAALELCGSPREGLIFRNYAPSGHFQRRYFQDEHARAIDGALATLRHWHRSAWLSRAELCYLLYAVLDAADRVANIAGVYAAYLKKWQSNTEQSWSLRRPEFTPGPVGQAFCGDSVELVVHRPCDILYIDPPYNSRQYAAFYHVREVMAEWPWIEDTADFENQLYGKTGMRPYSHLKSDFCVRARAPDLGGQRRCESAFHELLKRARARHIIVSYNQEGIVPRDVILNALADYSGLSPDSVDENSESIEVSRFRSDADGRNGRSYRVLDGKHAGRVDEWLFYARARPELDSELDSLLSTQQPQEFSSSSLR